LAQSDNANGVTTRFSTDDVPEQDRVATLHDVLGRVHFRAEIEPHGDIPYRGSFEHHSWSSVSLLFARTGSASFARTPELLGDGNGDFRLTCPEEATASFSSNGTNEEVSAGGGLLVFNGAPGKLRYETGDVISFRIGYRRLVALLIDPKLAALPINDIATRVGYVEHSTFTRAFRRRFGDSPRGVRNGGRG
jgi:AraC-like DNA-binding protein